LNSADTLFMVNIYHVPFEILTICVKISNMKYPRNLKLALLAATKDTPVVLLNGARQTGKSTLLGHLKELSPYRLINLDDLTVLQALRGNAQAYLAGLTERHIIIDEVQRAPEIFLPLKEAVDHRREPGRFLLTGSANVLMLPQLADTLAGRMEILNLWPLSQGELRGIQESFVDFAFSDAPFTQLHAPQLSFSDLASMLVQGGYPEAVSRSDPRRRSAWFHAYINTLLQRDVRDLSQIEGLSALPDLLKLIATRTGGLLNIADLSRSLSISNPTLTRYFRLLEAIFLIISIPPWFTNLGKRLVKSPRLYLNDTGILCHLLDLDIDTLMKNRNQFGWIVENFVVMELVKQLGWSEKRVRLSHYRTHTGQEVDIILESGLQVVGIEVKSSSQLTAEHCKGLHYLKSALGDRFHRGIILYTGQETVLLQEDIWAVPISALWGK
jgi:uncharacterized protein